MKAIVTGDIGCYTLGALPPLSAMDTCVDMGASVSMAHGFELALAGTEHRPVVAVIGDSTFAHSGLSSLVSTVYNRGSGTVCVLDNRTTAMTGRQGNPFNGETLQKRPSRELDLEGVVRALGVEDVRTRRSLRPEGRADARSRRPRPADALSVLVFRRPCVLLDRVREDALCGRRRLHGLRRVHDAGLPGHREGPRDGAGVHRRRPVHRLRPMRPVLRFRSHFRSHRSDERRNCRRCGFPQHPIDPGHRGKPR